MMETRMLQGKTALITGGYRGVGRACAIRLAELGADVMLVDIGRNLPTLAAGLASDEDLEQTRAAVAALGRQVESRSVDIRDRDALANAIASMTVKMGGLDIVVASAGVFPIKFAGADELKAWDDAVSVNLTGTWNTVRVTAPILQDQGRGGVIVVVNSTAGLRGTSDGWGGYDGYVAAKHGLVGLVASYANMLGPHGIRVNGVHPTAIATSMVLNAENGAKRLNPTAYPANLLPVRLIEAQDVANAVGWLASDEARYVTGVALPIDAGFSARK